MKTNDTTDGSYKTQTLKCIKAALGCYFKDTRSIEIIRNELFLKAKEIGLGEIEPYPPIEDADLEKLTEYFKQQIEGPANV